MAKILNEMKEWKRDWPLLVFGMFAAFADGLMIAQAYDWISTSHRMSIWVLL